MGFLPKKIYSPLWCHILPTPAYSRRVLESPRGTHQWDRGRLRVGGAGTRAPCPPPSLSENGTVPDSYKYNFSYYYYPHFINKDTKVTSLVWVLCHSWKWKELEREPDLTLLMVLRVQVLSVVSPSISGVIGED